MVGLKKRCTFGLLGVALVAISTLAFAPTLEAQCCEGCEQCCDTPVLEQATCSSPGCFGDVNFYICEGGRYNDIYATSSCIGCCNSLVETWSASGQCAAPAQAKSSRDVSRQDYLVFVRRCDGTYALTTVGAAT